MKKRTLVLAVATLFAVCAFSMTVLAQSAEMKLVGVITKIKIAGPAATTATAILKDTKTEKLVEIVINDELTLDKFKDHRIVEGDEIRCKYKSVDGKNVSNYFRKTAGC
ncbi:MAG: hypothetical protein HYU52_08590 [Acidobacteria bacterium]|nr:hypothetical protein [Acidobacteriota bacterium]